MRRGTLTHPKMRRLARLLGVRIAEAYGLVSGLLDWAYYHAMDGAVGRWDDEEIAHGAHCECVTGPVFIQALLKAGWIDHDSTKRLVIHDLADHADDTWRKMLARRGKRFAVADGVPQVRENTNGPDGVQTKSRQSPDFVWDIEPDRARPDRARPDAYECSALVPVRAKTTRRSAKRRDAEEPEGFVAFWHAYPNHAARDAALKAWLALDPDPGLQADLMAALEQQRRWPRWLDRGGHFVPHASSWLNGRRWRDEAPRPAVAFSGRTAGNAAAIEAFIRGGKS